MKRTNVILFALFLLLSTGQLWAQEQKPYKPAVEFKGDTLRYLEYNYTIRYAQYIGKTVGEILKELEYPVLYIVEYGIEPTLDNTPSKLPCLSLGIRQTGKKPSPLKDYYIRVDFENPPVLSEYKEASGTTLDNPYPLFSQKLYDFIKNLKVEGICSNKHIIKDPELLKIRKQREEQLLKDAKRGEEIWEELRKKREAKENQ